MPTRDATISSDWESYVRTSMAVKGRYEARVYATDYTLALLGLPITSGSICYAAPSKLLSAIGKLLSAIGAIE